MNPVDHYVLTLMESIESPLLTEICKLISNSVTYPILILIFLYFAYRRKDEFASNMIIGGLIEGLTSLTLKGIIGRPRPVGLSQEIGSSFPSGHTGRSTFLAHLFSSEYGKRILWYSLAALVMFSRLYLRVHYLTDVIGGIIVGSGVYFLVKRYDVGPRVHEYLKRKITR